MAVSAIQKNDSSSKMSYTKSAAVGAITGYSLKYILPITPQERDARYMAALDQKRALANQSKKDGIQALKSSKTKDEAADKFILLADSKKLKISEIRQTKEPVKSGIFKIIKALNENARIIYRQGLEEVIALTKSIRPAGIFITAGAFAAVAGSFIDNVVNGISTDKPE